MMHHHPFWIEIFIYFFTLVLPKFPLRTKSRENLKGDFFAYICTQRERDAEKKREKALERERRKKKRNVRRKASSLERSFRPNSARYRDERVREWGGFSRAVSRADFFFFFSLVLCVLLAR